MKNAFLSLTFLLLLGACEKSEFVDPSVIIHVKVNGKPVKSGTVYAKKNTPPDTTNNLGQYGLNAQIDENGMATFVDIEGDKYYLKAVSGNLTGTLAIIVESTVKKDRYDQGKVYSQTINVQ